MFVQFSPLQTIMTLAIIVSGAFLLFLVYQAFQGRGKENLPLGILILAGVVILEKILLSRGDFLDWATVVVFSAGGIAALKMLLTTDRKEG